MGWRRKLSMGKPTTSSLYADDDSGSCEHSHPPPPGPCGSGRCSCGVQTDPVAPCGCCASEAQPLPFCGEFGYVPVTPPQSPGAPPPLRESRESAVALRCRPRRPAPLDLDASPNRYGSTPPRPLRRRRSGLPSPLMSPGAGRSKRSGPAWALTCAVAATAVLTAGGALSSSSDPVVSLDGPADPAISSLPPSASSPASAASKEPRRVGRGIGDSMRSTSSSSLFFKLIDRDGDGFVRPKELAGFVRQKIGGSAFDAEDEVEAGVSNAMAAIDRDNDEGLDRNDVFAYWMKLESLLTVDEVAEWVVHAVQLPESVGKIFKENVVTGYDFPELVENDGDALEKDLGIEKSSFRKKIVRHIHARMLGIGTNPTAPPKFDHRLESCSTASLSWSKSTAKGFPVHSYRVQRRAVDLHGQNVAQQRSSAATNASGAVGNHSQMKAEECKAHENGVEEGSANEQCTASRNGDASLEQVKLIDEESPSITSSSASSASDWVTVYHGNENDFVDTGLAYGHNYVYRVQAWNSVGRSEWSTLDMAKSLRKQKCSTRAMPASRSFPPENVSAGGTFYQSNVTSWPWSFLSGSYMLASCLIFFIRAVFTLTAVAAAIMRFKRASAKSTLSAEMEPVFPWLWKGINALSVRAVGMEVIPQSILSGREGKRSSYYDKEINAVGLHGYERGTRDENDDDGGNGSERKEDEGSSRVTNRRVMFRRMKSHSTGNLAMMDSQKQIGSAAAAPKILRNKRGRLASDDATLATPSPGSVALVTTPKSSLFRRGASRSMSSCNSDDDDTDSSQNKDSRSSDVALVTPQRNLFRKEASTRTLSTREGSSSDGEDDNTPNEQQLLVLSDRSGLSDCYEDDHTKCNSCRKSYKFPKRFRHHCARCMSTFCHKHGKTTHSNLVSCRVPGDCVCNVCLELEGFNSRSGRDEGGSSGCAALPSSSTTKSSKRWKR